VVSALDRSSRPIASRLLGLAKDWAEIAGELEFVNCAGSGWVSDGSAVDSVLASCATVECVSASAITAAASCEDDSSAASFAATSTRD
jgi:hypothetical protein